MPPAVAFTPARRDVRALLTDAAFNAVLATVLDNNPGMGITTAGRIVVEALKFTAAAARFPTVRIAPSREVDEGWHALILHTHLYASLCRQLGRPDPSRFDADVLTRTVALIEQAGYNADTELWTGPSRALVTVAANPTTPPCPATALRTVVVRAGNRLPRQRRRKGDAWTRTRHTSWT